MEVIASHAIDTSVFIESLFAEELKHVRIFSVDVFNSEDQSIEKFDNSSNTEKIIKEVLETVLNSVAEKLSSILNAVAKMIEDLLSVSTDDEPRKSSKTVDMSKIGVISNAAVEKIIIDLVAEERVNLEKIPGFLPWTSGKHSKNRFYVNPYDETDIG
jgi:rubrerythrin